MKATKLLLIGFIFSGCTTDIIDQDNSGSSRSGNNEILGDTLKIVPGINEWDQGSGWISTAQQN